jgi:hypothetical protein
MKYVYYGLPCVFGFALGFMGIHYYDVRFWVLVAIFGTYGAVCRLADY